jgi:hypothetical protein
MNMTAVPIGRVGHRCTRRECMVAATSYSQVCTASHPRQGVPAAGTPEVQKESVRQAIEIICIQRSETKLLDRVEKPGTTHVVACAQGQAMWWEARRVPVGALALAHARPTCHSAQLKANSTSWHRLPATAYNPGRRTLACAGVYWKGRLTWRRPMTGGRRY